MTRGRVLFFVVAAVVFAADRVTKSLVVASIPANTEIGPYAGIIWIQHLQNPCAAFSVCGPSNIVFLLISLVVTIAILVYEFQQLHDGWIHLVLGMVLGGTAGNGYDRLLHGSVTDFLALHWFPTFNVADSAITMAIVSLAAWYLLKRQPAE
ncbi:MAG: signal peptidase II [Candidatus Dormibacteraeota bacterium]|nr:signal peptidase II [Candidatus Dormibacteraeota bacterium]